MKTVLLVGSSGSKPLTADPSVWYRLSNLQRALKEIEIGSSLISQSYLESHVESGGLVPAADVVVFFRPSYSTIFHQIVDEIKGRSRLIADYDDLNFDLRVYKDLQQLPKWQNGTVELVRGIQMKQEAASLFQEISVSTPFLATKAKLNFPQAHIHLLPNHVPDEFVARARHFRGMGAGSKIVGYFGGPSHRDDLEMVTGALAGVLNQVDGKILVSEQLGASLARLGNRVRHFHVLPIYESSSFYSEVDVSIAPLRLTDFNRSKSAVKFLESAIHGVPLVATPHSDLARYKSPLLHFANTESEWEESILRALDMPVSLRNREAELVSHAGGRTVFTKDYLRPMLAWLGDA